MIIMYVSFQKILAGRDSELFMRSGKALAKSYILFYWALKSLEEYRHGHSAVQLCSDNQSVPLFEPNLG